MTKLRIESILKELKISKRSFAKRLGIDPSNVFRFFKEDYDPKLSTLEEWAKVLGVKIRDLFEEPLGPASKKKMKRVFP